MKIPLIEEHSKEDLKYFQLPEIQLGVLLDNAFEEVTKRTEWLVDYWMKNSKCKCMKNLRKDLVLEAQCPHFVEFKEKDELFRRINKKISKLSSVSILRTMKGDKQAIQEVVDQ